jgi:glycerol-3-phosphate dehydrogenase (NAD(P)+)
MIKDAKIAILGAGCWGVTLAILLIRKKYEVSIWEISEERSKRINESHTMEFLPGVKIPERIKVSSNLEEIVSKKNIIVFAIPSHFVRETSVKLAELKKDYTNCVIVNASKGLERNTLKRISEIIPEVIPQIGDRLCAISGPSFAKEVANRIPTAVVMAGSNPEANADMQKIFSAEYLRVYTHTDITGVELGGALKNVFAISCGMGDGLGFGDNTKAALVTRGSRELIKLGIKLGGQPQTFYGLSGIGDLIVTCFSKLSRNRLFGEKIGSGMKPQTALEEIKMVVEGYRTTNPVYSLSKRYDLDLPIINETYNVLYKNKPVKDTITALMSRGLKSETEGLEF